LANALLSNNQLPEAIEQYNQALQLQPERIDAWIKLTSAYAQANHPKEAATAAQKALDLARKQGQTALAQQIETWLTAELAGQISQPHIAPSSDDAPTTPNNPTPPSP
jgi:tetratricopeptide (TPR) repeat protein